MLDVSTNWLGPSLLPFIISTAHANFTDIIILQALFSNKTQYLFLLYVNSQIGYTYLRAKWLLGVVIWYYRIDSAPPTALTVDSVA